MTTDDTKRVVEEFIKYLQLPNSPYSLTESDSSDEVEMQIAKGDTLLVAVSINNGNVSILYNGDFEENKFFKQEFHSPIYLLYILSIIFYSTVCKEVNISYDDLMTIILGEEISNWKDLVVALADKVMVDAEADMDDVLLDGKKLSYQDFSGKLTYGSLEYQLQPHSYTQLIESIYLIVEYVATLNDTQDSLFTDKADDNVIGEEEQEEVPMGGLPMGMGGGEDIPMDMGEGVPEPVTPDEAENPVDQDFSMPDGLDDDSMNGLLESDEEE